MYRFYSVPVHHVLMYHKAHTRRHTHTYPHTHECKHAHIVIYSPDLFLCSLPTGVAFRGLPNVRLYPSVSAVYGNTEVSMVYLGPPLDG